MYSFVVVFTANIALNRIMNGRISFPRTMFSSTTVSYPLIMQFYILTHIFCMWLSVSVSGFAYCHVSDTLVMRHVAQLIVAQFQWLSWPISINSSLSGLFIKYISYFRNILVEMIMSNEPIAASVDDSSSVQCTQTFSGDKAEDAALRIFRQWTMPIHNLKQSLPSN